MTAWAILLAAAMHEFAWQLWPAGLQGDVRAVTQWALICSLCWTLHVAARSPAVSAACAACAVMSSTTAGCSAYWLATRFVTLPGEDQCSRAWSVPMMLASALAALAALWKAPRCKT